MLHGTTVNWTATDLGKENFSNEQIYVVLSRVKCVNGPDISDLVLNKILNKPHDERALAEMQRLRLLRNS
jgi:hypothetical protein